MKTESMTLSKISNRLESSYSGSVWTHINCQNNPIFQLSSNLDAHQNGRKEDDEHDELLESRGGGYLVAKLSQPHIKTSDPFWRLVVPRV